MEFEFSNVHHVALWGFLAATAFGAVAHHARFCAVGAISDWLHIGDSARLRAWLLAIGVAVLGVQLLKALTAIDFQQSIYLTPHFNWLGHVLGGLLFGVGMTLASGCGQRALVLVGGGNVKALAVLLVLALAAYLALHGPLAPVRTALSEIGSIDLSAYGMADQSISAGLVKAAGALPSTVLDGAVGAVVGLGLVAFVFGSHSFRRHFDQISAGAGVGLVVVAGWYITGVIGFDERVLIESYAFVTPLADLLRYLTAAPGSSVGFGAAAVFGVAFGSLLYAVVTGTFRLQGFASRGDLLAHLAGGALMGFGGVLALGDTIGQGIAGMSVLAFGSVLTFGAIVFGAALAMRTQYHLLDQQGFWRALRLGLADLRLLPMPRKANTV